MAEQQLVGASASPPPSLHPAEWMYERIARSIIDFEKKLDPTEEVGARLINFGANEVISVDGVGFWGTDLIIFYGRNRSGHRVELLQHITQVNVLLVAVPATEPAKRIGFLLEEHLSKKA